jgi:hypothetical protein
VLRDVIAVEIAGVRGIGQVVDERCFEAGTIEAVVKPAQLVEALLGPHVERVTNRLRDTAQIRFLATEDRRDLHHPCHSARVAARAPK